MNNLLFGSVEYSKVKSQILNEFKVTSTEVFDVHKAVRNRIDYLKNFLKKVEMRAYVLGISGGVDSTAVGRLAQIACNELRVEGYEAYFIAVRLPAGIQHDEEDAQSAIKFIKADKTLTVNVGQAANNLSFHGLQEFISAEGNENAPTYDEVDFNKGNIKARLRMLVQYQIAAMYKGLVLETTNVNELVSGFSTKWADSVGDLSVINGLNKRQVRLVTKELGAPEFLWNKVATADLEENSPQKTDESALGFSYDVMDDFLEGKKINPRDEEKIVLQYLLTQHKRLPIPKFRD